MQFIEAAHSGMHAGIASEVNAQDFISNLYLICEYHQMMQIPLACNLIRDPA